MRFEVEKAREIMAFVANQPHYPSPVFVYDNMVNMQNERSARLEYEDTSGVYQCLLLRDWNLLKGEELQDGRVFRIDRLTAFGHDIFEQIEKPTVWEKIKGVAKAVKSVAEFVSLVKEFLPDNWLAILSR